MIGRKVGLVGVVAVLSLAGSLAHGQQLNLAENANPELQVVNDPDHPADLQFDSIKHDFGRVSDEGKLEHIFRFTNKGTGALAISNVKGSCSCTVPALSKKVYAPGESGEIRVIYNPKSRVGRQHQTITVNSNDADTPLMQLSITAYVRPELVVEPRVGHFGEVPKDTEKTIELVVTGRDPEFYVEKVECSDPENFVVVVGETVDAEIPIETGEEVGHDVHLAAQADAANAPAQPAHDDEEVEYEKVRQCKISVTMKPGQEIGLIRGKTLTIHHSDSRRPPIQVELMAQHKGDLDMMPRRVTLGALEPGQEFSQVVTLKSMSGTPFKVIGIERNGVVADTPDFAFYPVDPADPSAYRIELSGEMPEDTRVLRGRLVIRTDMDREEEVFLYYYAQSKPRPQATDTGGN